MDIENSSNILLIKSNENPLEGKSVSLCYKKGRGIEMEGGDCTALLSSYGCQPDPTVTRPRRRHRKRGRKRNRDYAATIRHQIARNDEKLRRSDVVEHIAADTFASQTGRRLETFVTVRWSLTGHGEDYINSRWSTLLNAARIWAARRSFELCHVWVHENPPSYDPAFNTHLLVNVPPLHRSTFRSWLTHQLGTVVENAVDVRPRTHPGYAGGDRLSYMLKGTDMATAIKYHLIHKGWKHRQGIVPFKRCGTSNNVAATARAEFCQAVIAENYVTSAQYAPAREETRFLPADNGGEAA